MRNTRKLFALMLCVAVFASLTVPALAAEAVFNPDSGQKLTIDGVAREYPLPIANYAGYTMLPLRAIVTDLGIPNDDEHIRYVAETKEVTLVSEDESIVVWLQQENDAAWVEKDGVRADLTLVCPVQNYQGSLYVPVRFVAESLGMLVGYDNASRTVLIRTPESLAVSDAALELEAAAEPTKMAVDFAGDLNMGMAGMSMTAVLAGQMLMDISDLEQIKMNIAFEMTAEGDTLATDLYLAGDTMYVDTMGEVVKMPLDTAGFSLADMQDMMDSLNLTGLVDSISDDLRLRTFAVPGPQEGQITVTVDAAFLYGPDSPVMEMLFDLMPAGLSFDVDKYELVMVIDTETGLPVAFAIDASMSATAEGETVSVDMQIEMAIDYDESLVVTVPQEIIDKAVEMPG